MFSVVNNNIKYIFAVLLFFFLLIDCAKKENFSLPPHEKKFAKIYTELLKLKQKFSTDSTAFTDSSRAILQKYHFTYEEYKQSLTYFNEKPERWEAFYKEVLKELKKTKTRSSLSKEHKDIFHKNRRIKKTN